MRISCGHIANITGVSRTFSDYIAHLLRKPRKFCIRAASELRSYKRCALVFTLFCPQPLKRACQAHVRSHRSRGGENRRLLVMLKPGGASPSPSSTPTVLSRDASRSPTATPAPDPEPVEPEPEEEMVGGPSHAKKGKAKSKPVDRRL